MNTGSGGETHDIAQDADGFAVWSAINAVCANTTCTVSLLYDQSGKGNNLNVAKKGLTNGGQWAGMDDFETVISSKGQLNVGGRQVWSLYMAERQGYRQTKEGSGVPLGKAAQGIYMLADGTHAGTACCWDFGNVSPDPTRYGVMNTLFFGKAFWGNGAGSAPWFMADFEAGVWAGGTNPGDPGWGALEGAHPANPNNPSMSGVKCALGFLKTNQTDWALRMANAGTATTVATAYRAGCPRAWPTKAPSCSVSVATTVTIPGEPSTKARSWPGSHRRRRASSVAEHQSLRVRELKTLPEGDLHDGQGPLRRAEHPRDAPHQSARSLRQLRQRLERARHWRHVVDRWRFHGWCFHRAAQARAA